MVRRLLRAAAAVLLLVAPAAAEWVNAPRTEVPLEGDGTTWIVRATVNGRASGRFLLDTGASLCVVTPTLLERIGLHASDESVALQTANGVVTAPLVRLADLAVSGNRAGGVAAVVYGGVPAGLDGIVGLSFLNRFSYSVDPQRRVLRLR
ncbi:MAG TPA: retropepsin-like aspartic protease [Candidatus Binatia bacterium]|nr:retropepsin-like aspartic protease [Candidatus Binatia bacterium]